MASFSNIQVQWIPREDGKEHPFSFPYSKVPLESVEIKYKHKELKLYFPASTKGKLKCRSRILSK